MKSSLTQRVATAVAVSLSAFTFSPVASAAQLDPPEQDQKNPPAKAEEGEDQSEKPEIVVEGEGAEEDKPSRWSSWGKRAADMASDAADAVSGTSKSAYEKALAAAEAAGTKISAGYSASSAWMGKTYDSVEGMVSETYEDVSITAADLRVLERTQSLLLRAEEAAAATADATGREANRLSAIGIDALADDPKADPNFQSSATNFALNKLPAVGAANRYSDACADWKEGKEILAALAEIESDEERAAQTLKAAKLMQGARQQALVACLDAGLDVATLGAATGVKGLADAQAVVDLLENVHSIAKLTDKLDLISKQLGPDSGFDMTGWNLSVVGPVADLALSYGPIGGFAESTLDWGADRLAQREAMREAAETEASDSDTDEAEPVDNSEAP